MNAIRVLWVFIVATVMATVVAVAAAFAIWSILPVQPGTMTALATLFIVAPGIGIAAGIVAASRAARMPADRGDDGRSGSRGRWRWLSATFAAAVGWTFGYAVALVAIDLSFPHRLIDPGSAPDWLAAMPTATGIAVALVMALAVIVKGRAAPGDR